MRKIYKQLTEDQKRRGIVFSSTFSNSTVETDRDTMHEVKASAHNRAEMIENLKDVKFFKDGPWKFCIERK